MDWKGVARDSVIVFVLTFIGGFIVGFFGAILGATSITVWLGLSNIVFGSAGFAYSSYHATERPWAHLCLVAIVVWILSLVNLLFGLSSVSSWALSIILIFILMAIGGSIGLFLRRRRKDA